MIDDIMITLLVHTNKLNFEAQSPHKQRSTHNTVISTTHRHRVTLVRLQRLVIGELHVNGATAHLRRIRIEAGNNGSRRHLVGHLEERLILALQHQHVCHAAEGHAELYHLCFAGLVRYVADVNNARRFTWDNDAYCYNCWTAARSGRHSSAFVLIKLAAKNDPRAPPNER